MSKKSEQRVAVILHGTTVVAVYGPFDNIKEIWEWMRERRVALRPYNVITRTIHTPKSLVK